jgi:hypothetical protein
MLSSEREMGRTARDSIAVLGVAFRKRRDSGSRSKKQFLSKSFRAFVALTLLCSEVYLRFFLRLFFVFGSYFFPAGRGIAYAATNGPRRGFC